MGTEHETKPDQSGPSLYQPTKATTARERLDAFPGAIDVGEQIVGSAHSFDLVAPKAPHGEHALANVSVGAVHENASRSRTVDDLVQSGMGIRAAEAFVPVGAQQWTTSAIPILFQPKYSGTHAADISILLRWTDGLVDQRIVRARGTARKLEEAPANALAKTGISGPEPVASVPTADLAGVTDVDKTALSNAKDLAVVAADALGDAQFEGVHQAEQHAANYERKLPGGEWWATFAELAITMAVGGVAGVIGRFAGQSLGSRVAGLATKGASEKVSGLVKEYAQVAITDTVKDGIKGAVRAPATKAALKLIKPPTNKHVGTPEPENEDLQEEVSSDNRLNFFAAQRAASHQLSREYKAFVAISNQHLQHGLLSDPKHAIAAMAAIGDAMDSGREDLRKAQQRESEWQWAAALARGSLGSEKVKIGTEAREVTKLGLGEGTNRAGDGVLTIRVSGNAVDGVGGVVDAHIFGVSQQIADRLLVQRLVAAPIPILIMTDTEWYTRDEVGRVRLARRDPDRESQRHREIQYFVDTVLSRPLKAWGIASIRTDDSGGKK